MATIEDFKAWLNELTRFSNTSEEHIEEVTPRDERPDGEKFAVRIYTDTNCYRISASERSRDAGYLGCIASSRKPRAGEDWTRGNDLADGPLDRETWERIKGDIISYEMVKVHRRRPAQIDEEERGAQDEINVTPTPGPISGDGNSGLSAGGALGRRV